MDRVMELGTWTCICAALFLGGYNLGVSKERFRWMSGKLQWTPPVGRRDG
jgi:hypothetical protein